MEEINNWLTVILRYHRRRNEEQVVENEKWSFSLQFGGSQRHKFNSYAGTPRRILRETDVVESEV